jgi:DNA-binding LacI/PurR family transcriptional regulator
MDETAHWVDVDGYAGMYAAVEHLLEQGAHDIGFVGWPQGSVSGDARYHGYVQALRDHGLTLNPQWEVRTENEISRGYAAGLQLLNLPPAPQAVIGVSDVIAVGILRSAQEQGRQLAVIGFDDTPLAEFSTPTLTSLRQPIEQVAALVGDMLFAQLEERPLNTKHYLLKPELIVRDSSRVPRTAY